jgi:spore coat polysaccharide biosynthesis protein SpsF
MSSGYETRQEEFWVGVFGDEYSRRNVGDRRIASNTVLFSRILLRTHDIQSLIEFGANVGLNLCALKQLLPGTELAAVEINQSAVDQLRNLGLVDVFHQSILEFHPHRHWDFVLSKGVLIHINPDHLPQAYESLYSASGRYVCLVEYYNPTPVMVPYRGQNDRLFKRDFAGEMMDRYPDLRLLDYGFVYRRDPNFPQDDCTWFLLEKS